MSFIDLFNRTKKTHKNKIDDYNDLFIKVLDVFFSQNNDTNFQKELGNICTNSNVIAEQLYWFFPSILFNKMFPDVKRVDGDTYTVCDKEGVEKKYLYSSNLLYQAIDSFLSTKYHTFDRDQCLSLLRHSSEFNAVNKALNNGSKLDDLMVFSIYMSNQLFR